MLRTHQLLQPSAGVTPSPLSSAPALLATANTAHVVALRMAPRQQQVGQRMAIFSRARAGASRALLRVAASERDIIGASDP